MNAAEAPGEDADQADKEGDEHKRTSERPDSAGRLLGRRDPGQLGLREASVELIQEESPVEPEPIGVAAQEAFGEHPCPPRLEGLTLHGACATGPAHRLGDEPTGADRSATCSYGWRSQPRRRSLRHEPRSRSWPSRFVRTATRSLMASIRRSTTRARGLSRARAQTGVACVSGRPCIRGSARSASPPRVAP